MREGVVLCAVLITFAVSNWALTGCAREPGAGRQGEIVVVTTTSATPRPTPASPSASPSGDPRASATATVPPGPPPSTAAEPIPSTIPRKPTAPDPTDFADPVRVARAWMSQFCFYDWQEDPNGTPNWARYLETEPAKAADRAGVLDEQAYRELRAQQRSGRCDEIQAQVTNRPSATEVEVAITARRILLVGKQDQPVGVERLRLARRVVLGDDGRWLVDLAVGG
ncbi:hypothetical protein F0L68_08230 [Solihabitans fulvus]|uniref:Mce-associated membrane protein n=1 Tax=Solihabitans fulvus TaxID=1892852 RepID=A0A5B2XLJ8_9PSEU|nr:hypothetical protein [Solihabitans fulvus]KAA2264216.1 hypothetical protein F0L68_08230 [Solihabitans fulvus]